MSNALSFKTGVTVAGSGLYPLSGNGLGTLSVLANLSTGGVHLVFDVSGYFLPDLGTASQASPPPVCKHGGSVQAVDCWEGGLRLSGSEGESFYLRAYREARIRIDLRQNGVLKHSTYAYWDGGMAFTFRTSFPFKGSWTWTAVCESCFDRTIVNPASGDVTVTNRRTSPLLYSRGALSVHPSGRFLQHQTAMKFFWLGDTAWAAPMRIASVTNSAPTWTTYTDDRVRLPNGGTAPPSAPTAGKYSVTQVSLAFHLGAGGYTACIDDPKCLRSAKRTAFTTSGALGQVPSPKSYWNPDYWRNLDRLVYEANQKGLVVVLTGVLDLFGAPGSIGAVEDVQIFARNLAARMAGFFVIYSVGWDNRVESATYSCGADNSPVNLDTGFREAVVNGFAADTTLIAKMKAVGNALDAAAPNQLITTHLGGGTPFFGGDDTYHDPGPTGQNAPLASPYSYFLREPWLDFNLFQSSQCEIVRPSVFQHRETGTPGGACDGFVAEPQLACVMRRARTMPAKFLSLKANDAPLPGPAALVKPAINGGARYERTVPSGQAPEPDAPYQCRHSALVTILSGASGPTGGVINVEEWRWPGDGMGITGPQAGRCPQHLKYVGLLLEGQVMEWERLRRKELMLRNAGTNENERSVVAASESNQMIVAYLPERAMETQRTLELAINQGVYVGFDSCRWSKTWWNPVNGRTLPVEPGQIDRFPRTCESAKEPTPCNTFQFKPRLCVGADARPNDRCDWVLVLKDLGLCPSTAAQTQVWGGLDDASGQWGVFAQPLASTGEPAGPLGPLGSLSTGVQAEPKVANRAGQGALVVWLAEDSDGEGYGVVARKLDAACLPTGGIVRVSEASQGDQVSPGVAAVGQTGYVATWTSYSEDGDRGEIYARYLDGDGSALAPPFRVNLTTAGTQGHSQVASDAAGNILFAWESWGQDGDGNGVFARRFDVSRTGSEEFQVYQAGAGWQYLAGLEASSTEGFNVTWQVYTPHGHDLGTWGQRIRTTGAPRDGGEFSVAGPEGGVGE